MAITRLGVGRAGGGFAPRRRTCVRYSARAWPATPSVMTDSSVNPRIAIIPCPPAPRPAPSGRADNMRERRLPGFWVISPFCLHISPDGAAPAFL